MATADPSQPASAETVVHFVPSAPERLKDNRLAAEIDRLRKAMAETFGREASFTSEPVMQISRELDKKINEYMRLAQIQR